ncbi:bifunctional DNA-formamidopyrimidine glycosylase/DNA-(apurinic or apyrimidinic site) lyase [Gordonia sp. HNM0687]|uniref:Formamidopyrimidine-DNA glycosylase n=1 Tax=Gordonia mangrovi TaxID=2665643 RepID=A0A6L7GSH6_9ACTN|nr:bifunctional DNA-formamidopyrimidine glycosylase/DNA-(apurinic or apyrimidinic site) lyase [Gordonia mangrovi]MXP22512.1 bifunctional DNA-formamidopyrimidine glycosylase/DNA-(apurinic or apyrimidinic site) lyase [Gordonia mangrovi]UVF77614.1 bifunctional DNA-formamidopyrimidine glycosylase/DNA-(apurinic or apyrimidinic site) lyase [Gordonia mangrovi]
MPELPEVETVRRGLADHVEGRVITSVEVLHPRSVRRHLGGGADLIGRLVGHRVAGVHRRGKYLWLDVVKSGDSFPLVVHLGMSGQMLIGEVGAEDHVHLRIRATLDDGNELRFVDQRTFGGWHVDEYVETPDELGRWLPESIAHIAPDPFDPVFDPHRVAAVIRSRHTEIKRALLDQTVISGVGNIYADEALWRSRVHGTRLTDGLSRAKVIDLLASVTDVMGDALVVGGTSFDSLYVNVNGESGYFERSLNAYGQAGEPCRRCGAIMRREQFMNRSSYYCPRCQRKR